MERFLEQDIYGKGVCIKPALDGRTDTEHFRSIYLPKLLPLEDYDLIAVLFSGGKDSTACFLHLLELGVPKDKIELWHHDIDGGNPKRRMDWPCTKEYVSSFAEAFGVRLRISYRINGFFGELYRLGASEPVEWVEPYTGEVKRCAPTKAYLWSEELKKRADDEAMELLKAYGGRHMFPAKSADLKKRWCSSYLKISVGASVISNLEDTRADTKILIVSGERREESAGRAKYNEMELHRTYAEKKLHRLVHQWRCCIDWSEKDVWDIMRRFGVNPHPCYRAGWNRCSCMACIFSTPRLYAGIKELYPAEWEALKEDEKRLGFTIDNKKDLETYIKGAESCVVRDDKRAIESLISGRFDVKDVFTDRWQYPAGAFHGADGGSC